MTTLLETLMAATVKIGGPKPGTGYLIAPNRIATCHHVIDLWEPAEKHEVNIGFPNSIAREAWVIKSDQKTDCAILGFEEPVTTTPLTIGDPLEVQTCWEGYGFPHSAGGDGLYFKGEVLIPKTEDQTGREVIHLFSPMAGSGAATPLHGFSGTPILVSGVVVGHMIRHVGDPDELKRPAYGVIYAVPIKGVEAILDVKPAKRHVDPPKLTEAKGFVEEMRKSGAQQARELDAPKDTTLAAAKVLIGQNRPDLALELLGSADAGTLQSKQMYALALAKAGKTKESIARLHELIKNGADDHETLGLLAGRYKDWWRGTGDAASLRAAYETYRSAFQKTNDPFNGINAAATALYCGEQAESAILAEEVSTLYEDAKDLNHWDLATVGEARLLQGKLDQAREWYKKAVGKEPDLYQDIAVMRRQARLNLKYLDKPVDALDDVLPVPRVLAFAGHMVDEDGRPIARFPKGKVPAVRLAIRDMLKELGFVQGFSTAAKGSDILFLEEMVKRNVKPLVVMPFPEKDFRVISMGEEWGQRFDDIRSNLEVVTLDAETPPNDQLPAAFAKANKKIQKMAVEHANRLGEKARLLVVWDGKVAGDGPGGTADVVKLWEEEGYKPIVINIKSLKGGKK